jgi:cysteinyl-tRNA synthetase
MILFLGQEPNPSFGTCKSTTSANKLAHIPLLILTIIVGFFYRDGPTVYQSAHMKQARNCISLDIIRRILQDYFGYFICSIMTVNDWDDKIMKQSKEVVGTEYTTVSQKYEKAFLEDMDRLGVLQPTIVTRVTDCMEQITEGIHEIVDQGLAYERHGSVFFDMHAYESQPKAHWLLTPELVRKAALNAENETANTNDEVPPKRSRRDFALWRPSETGEPEFTSSWGLGRPTWHVTFNASAGVVLLQKLVGTKQAVLYSGDLHDAQSAKHWIQSADLNGWSYSVRGALEHFVEHYTPRHLRLLCLLHKYSTPIECNEVFMRPVLTTEKLLRDFFRTIQEKQKEQGLATASPHKHPNIKWDFAASQLQVLLQESSDQVDAALKDDFDTPTVMKILVSLVKATADYLSKGNSVVMSVPLSVARFVTRILQVFGVADSNTSNDIGFDGSIVEYKYGQCGLTREEALTPVLDVVAEFMTRAANDQKSGCDLSKPIFNFPDHLSKVGVKLEEWREPFAPDQGDYDEFEYRYVWKLVVR